MAEPEQDEIPLENLVVYEHVEERLDDSAWPAVWLQRIRDRFRLRTREASRNLGLRTRLLELLQAAQEVRLQTLCINIINKITLN